MILRKCCKRFIRCFQACAFSERLVRHPIFTPNCLWLHGASLGECRVLKTLALLLEEPILITSQKAEVVRQFRNEQQNIFDSQIQFSVAPLPIRFFIKKFLKKIKPKAIIFCENELWPAYLQEASQFKIPLALVSGRMVKTRFLPRFCFPNRLEKLFVFADFQTIKDEARFLQKFPELKNKTSVGGNWKLLRESFQDIKSSQNILSQTPIKSQSRTETKIFKTVFASLHFSEWASLKKIFSALSFQGEAFAIAPRRQNEIELFQKALQSSDIPVCVYPQFKSGSATLVTGFGLLRKIFQQSESAVIGGSFSARPGIHDFYEPLAFGLPVYVGPYAYGQQEIVSEYIQKNILQKLAPNDSNFPPRILSSADIIKFLDEEIQKNKQSYLNLVTVLQRCCKQNLENKSQE